MTEPLRVLCVDDSEDDTWLLTRELQRCGYDPQVLRVETPAALRAALTSQSWDLVLTDYVLPHFDSLEPLKILGGSGLDLPCIMVSGSMGEEFAVAAMKAGAHDYLLKDHLERLGPAIERERREAANRARRRRLEEQKNEFLSLASHELKTPITAISGMAYLLLKRAEQDGTPDRERRALNIIIQQSERLTRLVNELLDITRIDQHRLHLVCAAVELGALAEQVAEQVRLLTNQHTITVAAAPPVSVWGDQQRLEQVLINLIENGVKYSPHGGPVTVHVGATADHGWAEVHDQGIGIPPEELPFVFERFFRAENVDVNSAGLGLGLYLCREVIKQHGGRITVESTLGSGSCFRVEVPLAPA